MYWPSVAEAMLHAPSLEDQALAMGGYCEYLWRPQGVNPSVVINNTSLAVCGDSQFVVQRRLQNRNGRLTVNWRENPSTLLIRKRGVDDVDWATLSEVSLLESDPALSLEDARILQFDNQNRRFIAATWEFSEPPRRGVNRVVTSQAVISLDCDFGILDVRYPNVGDNLVSNAYEKNWMPIPDSDNITYSLSGSHIVRGLWSEESFVSPGLQWEFGEIHGGTQWVRQGDSMLGVFHSSRPISESSWRGVAHNQKYFVLGAALAQASPPYRILAATAKPLFWSSPENPRVANGSILLFANGFAIDGSTALLSMGVNDAASAVVSLPLEAVYSALHPC